MWDGSGADGVYQNVILGQIVGQILGEHDHGRFDRVIVHQATWLLSEDRGDIDDPPPALFHHLPDHGPAAVENPLEVRVDKPVPVFLLYPHD